MRTTLAAALALMVSVLICPAHAGFVTFTLTPISQTVNVGDTADVILGISGLGDYASPSLSAFTLGLAFDPALLSVRGVTFGDPGTGFDYLAPSGPVGSMPTYGLTGPGMLALSELSLELPPILVTIQPDAFALATVTFDAIAPGTSPLVYGGGLLVDEQGSPLWPDPVFSSGFITVQAVPVPGALVLGLIGLGFLTRCASPRSRKKSQ